MGGRTFGWFPVGRAVAAGVLSAVVAAVLAPGVAMAHNSLTSSDPKNGATVARPPAAVRLTFLSRLDPATTTVAVTGPDGAPAAAGAPRFAGRTVTVPVRATAAGRYTVAYQVASSDGHPIKGTVRFTVTTGTTPAAPSPPAPPPAATPSTPPPTVTATAPSLAPASGEGTADTGGWWWLAGLAVVLGLLAGVLVWRRRARAG
ncbi:MAG TPA: copper resistance CopC family protein [Pilimelia sp.]|nr:copper resistance CopC family protein [Pilimelia sp.]